ncbi:unnamed protein product [Rotaria sordida]|uniref:Uncharacterized protein n=1 Tax=Rotaria sordida TaxID=392033 RepID=A0A815PW81_9BILA|nr:unnamed protein product [Rotaria sordida]CAF1454774.1 unnamed protein product [Rotaria sordida]
MKNQLDISKGSSLIHACRSYISSRIDCMLFGLLSDKSTTMPLLYYLRRFKECSYNDLPYLSFTLHQKACCLYMAFLAFIMHDVALKYLPTYINFALLWVMSIVDIITCLHPRWRMDDPITKALVHAVSFDYPTVP